MRIWYTVPWSNADFGTTKYFQITSYNVNLVCQSSTVGRKPSSHVDGDSEFALNLIDALGIPPGILLVGHTYKS